MADRADPPPAAGDNPTPAADAISLHTIAEQADAYAAQEQEDADFAYALALEDQESARFARIQRIIHPQGGEATESRPALETETFPPYRDDPDADNIDSIPYRDDPDADPAEGEQITDAEAAATLPQRQNLLLRILRKVVKAWLCYLICSTVFTIVVVAIVLLLAFIYGGKQGIKGDPKEAAWLASGSQDYDLNLSKLYPALEASTSNTCKKTWDELASGLPCHRVILSPAWDSGNAEEAKAVGLDPVYYNEAVCTMQCKSALAKLESPMRDTCARRTDRFDFNRYGKDGKAYFEKESIDEGPADVSRSLLARYDRLCSGPPKRYLGQKPLSCAEDLWLTWGIVAGKDEANLNGLDTFLEQTSVKKWIPPFRQTIVKLTGGTNATYGRSVKGRRVGPGRGETECSNCLRDWLEKKMLSFRYGQMLAPGTRTPLGLAEFAEKINNASQRCERYSKRDFKVWEAMGWWCNGAPCNKDDDSTPPAVVDVLHGYDKTHAPSQPFRPHLSNVPSNKKEVVSLLLDTMDDMRCGALGLTPSDLTNPLVTSAHVVSRLCTPRCLNSIDRVAVIAEAAKYPGSPFTPITDSITTVRALCKSSSPISFTTMPDTICAPGYAALNMTSLIASPPSPSSSFASNPPLPRASILATFRTALASVREWNDDPLSNIMQYHQPLQRLHIAESVCNTCVGAMFIGEDDRWNETVNAFLKDPEINGTEYVRVAREGWLECGKMFGIRLRGLRKKQFFEKVGLGEGVGGVPIEWVGIM